LVLIPITKCIIPLLCAACQYFLLHKLAWTDYFGSCYAGFIKQMNLKATDQSIPYIDPQPGEDPEEQGLRILARFIARKLERSRRDERARAYERSEDDKSTLASSDENIS
jgi:hypothetical protein